MILGFGLHLYGLRILLPVRNEVGVRPIPGGLSRHGQQLGPQVLSHDGGLYLNFRHLSDRVSKRPFKATRHWFNKLPGGSYQVHPPRQEWVVGFKQLGTGVPAPGFLSHQEVPTACPADALADWYLVLRF